MAFQPTAEQLRAGVQHIRYEYDMFSWIIATIPTRRGQGDETGLLVEGLLIHGRLLRDFFRSVPTNEDDILARHYLDDPAEWNGRICCPYLEENRTRMNKLLAHLTYSRPADPGKWDFVEIRDEVNAAWNKFLSSLSDDRKKWFT